MLKSIQNLFGKNLIYQYTNEIYDMIILNLKISLLMLPWIVTNTFIKLTSETILLYGLIGVFIYPVLLAMYIFLHKKKTVNLFFLWKKNFLKASFFGIIVNVIVLFFLFDLRIIISNHQLLPTLPAFIILFIFLVSTSHYLIYFISMDNTYKLLIKSIYYSIRNLVYTIGITSLTFLWLTLFYVFPLINILFGNILFIYCIHLLLKKNLKKYVYKK